jgi:hypothetical protein
MGIFWISAKILGGTRSYSKFAAEMAFAQIGISLANVIVAIIEFIIMAIVATNAVAGFIGAITTGGSLGILSAFSAFASTMMIGGIITGLISLVFGLYVLYVLVIFVRETMELSTLKAIVAIFLPLIVVFILGALASVMVWYWITPITSGTPSGFTPTYPAGGGAGTATQYNLIVEVAYKNAANTACTSMDVKNTGWTTIPSDVIFEVKKNDGTATGNYVVIRRELSPGERGTFDIVSSPFDSSARSTVPLGSYFLRLSSIMGSSGFAPDIYFTC